MDLRKVWNLIPLIQNVSFGRYIMASCELSMIMLAGLGIMDFAHSAKAKRLFMVTTSVMLLGLIWIVLATGSLNNGIVYGHRARIIYAFLDAVPFLAVIALLVLGRFAKARWTPILVSALLVAESLLIFAVPSGKAPKYVNVDMAPIHFLQKHEGHYRFFDFGVLSPNWGSQYGLNELNAIDLPFPKKFASFIQRQLSPGLTPANQFLTLGGITGMDSQMQEVVTHFAAYEGASVKYLLLNSQAPLLPALANLGVKKVFGDSLTTIYQMPTPRPFISTRSTSCTVRTTSDDSASVNCPNAGSTLVRTELSMAGWKAYVNGKSVTMTTVDGVYQGVKVPAGTSTVTYDFLPPHEKYAILLALLAALSLLGTWVYERRNLFLRRPPSEPVAD